MLRTAVFVGLFRLFVAPAGDVAGAQAAPLGGAGRTLQIHVVDSRTGRYVTGATVRISPRGVAREAMELTVTRTGALTVETRTGIDHVIEVQAFGYVDSRVVSGAGQSRVEIRMEPRPVAVPEIRATGPGGSPQTEYVLDRETQALAGDDLGDWLRSLPGFDVTQRGPGGRSLLTIRGSRPQAVEIILDGIPLTDPLTGVADLSLIPGSTIERVVAHAGAGSGAGWAGSAGTVRLESRGFDPGVGIGLRMGSHGYRRTEVTGGLTTGALDLGAALTYDGARNDFGFVNRVSPGRPAERRVNADHEGWWGLLRAGLRRTPLRLVARAGGMERGAPGRMGTRLWESARWHERSASVGVAYGSWGGSGEGDARATAAWSLRSQRYDDPRIGRADSLRAHQFVLAGVERLPWLDLEWRGTWARARGSALNGRADRGTLGVLLSRTESLGAAWSARAGLGLDGATGIGVGLSPTLGVQWKPRQSVRLWARAGRAFRLPTFGDVFLRPERGARSNPDLRPERVELDSEIGARVTRRDSGLEAGVTAFLRLTRDPILWLPSVVSVWSPINGGFLRAYGVESSVGWVPAPGWQVALNGTIQSSRLGFDGYSNPLPYHAHLSGRASLERRGRGPDVRVDLEVQAARRTSVFGPHELPAVALLGVRSRQELTVAGIDAVLEVGVSNVLDAAYERVELFPEPGRRFEIRIDVGARSPESLP